MNCVVCDKPINKKARTCGNTCRSKLARSVAKPSVASPKGPSVAIPECIVDATGHEHKIDYEGRHRDYELLESWAKGKGTEYQRSLGLLSRHYRPLDFIVTSYLGQI